MSYTENITIKNPSRKLKEYLRDVGSKKYLRETHRGIAVFALSLMSAAINHASSELKMLFHLCLFVIANKNVRASQCTVQNYEKFWNRLRKVKKYLQGMGKMPTFASSNLKFDYPGRIPSWGQDHIATVPLKSCFGQLFIYCIVFQMF